MTDHAFMNSEKLTINDLLAIFGRTPDETRWVGFADSAEYLSRTRRNTSRLSPTS